MRQPVAFWRNRRAFPDSNGSGFVFYNFQTPEWPKLLAAQHLLIAFTA
jgi:hypothetical protein